MLLRIYVHSTVRSLIQRREHKSLQCVSVSQLLMLIDRRAHDRSRHCRLQWILRKWLKCIRTMVCTSETGWMCVRVLLNFHSVHCTPVHFTFANIIYSAVHGFPSPYGDIEIVSDAVIEIYLADGWFKSFYCSAFCFVVVVGDNVDNTIEWKMLESRNRKSIYYICFKKNTFVFYPAMLGCE